MTKKDFPNQEDYLPEENSDDFAVQLNLSGHTNASGAGEAAWKIPWSKFTQGLVVLGGSCGTFYVLPRMDETATVSILCFVVLTVALLFQAPTSRHETATLIVRPRNSHTGPLEPRKKKKKKKQK